jgi:DNA-binding protein HU-beta
MNQAELINAIAAHHTNTGVSKAAIKFMLEAQGEITQTELSTGNDVTLPGIGKLTVETRSARTGRNPKTGAEIAIAEKRVPKFSASKALKDAVMMENSHG